MNYNLWEYVTFYSLCSVFDMLSDHLDSHLQRIKKQFNIVKSFLIRIPTSKVSWACTANIYSVKYKVSLYSVYFSCTFGNHFTALWLPIIAVQCCRAKTIERRHNNFNWKKIINLYKFMFLVPYIRKIYALDDRCLCLLEVLRNLRNYLHYSLHYHVSKYS